MHCSNSIVWKRAAWTFCLTSAFILYRRKNITQVWNENEGHCFYRISPRNLHLFCALFFCLFYKKSSWLGKMKPYLVTKGSPLEDGELCWFTTDPLLLSRSPLSLSLCVGIKNRACAQSHCPSALCRLTAAVNELTVELLWHHWESQLLSFMFIFHICAVAQHTELLTRALPFLGWCFVFYLSVFFCLLSVVEGGLVSDAWNEMWVVSVLIGCSNGLHVYNCKVRVHICLASSS